MIDLSFLVTRRERQWPVEGSAVTHTPIWIRIFDLPMGMMDRENGMVFGNTVGEALMVDMDADGSGIGGYLRVKVRLDVRKPLRRGITLEDVGGGVGKWCCFEYEHLPTFCYGCGRLGHMEKGCDFCEVVESKQYGEWLRATLVRWKSPVEQRGRWSDGNSSEGCRQGRSWESGNQGLSKEKYKPPFLAMKSAPCADPDLCDDGTSPVKEAPKRMSVMNLNPHAPCFAETGEEGGRGEIQWDGEGSDGGGTGGGEEGGGHGCRSR